MAARRHRPSTRCPHSHSLTSLRRERQRRRSTAVGRGRRRLPRHLLTADREPALPVLHPHATHPALASVPRPGRCEQAAGRCRARDSRGPLPGRPYPSCLLRASRTRARDLAAPTRGDATEEWRTSRSRGQPRASLIFSISLESDLDPAVQIHGATSVAPAPGDHRGKLWLLMFVAGFHNRAVGQSETSVRRRGVRPRRGVVTRRIAVVGVSGNGKDDPGPRLRYELAA
jgi:hypothetical protein